MQLTEIATDIFNQTLSHVNPSKIISEAVIWNKTSGELTIRGKSYAIHENQPVFVIGAGKASVPMALGIENVMQGRIRDGIVISPDPFKGESRIQVFTGSHPLPDKESLSSSYELVSFLQKIPNNSFVINLISGGTSSLFCLPAGDLDIEEINNIYSLLIESGANIHEINTVRKVFSSVKGGQLLKYLKGKQVVDLMISDITDDDIKMIGSGPSVAQDISAIEAFKILKQYKLYNSIPHIARQFIASEMDKEMKNNSYRNTEEIDRHWSFIIASASMMASRASEIAEEQGFETTLNQEAVAGPVDEVTQSLISQIRTLTEKNKSRQAIVSFGEPTVQVKGDGLGGRNQELALRMAHGLKDFDHPIAFLSAGTDGIDGPTDAAGAVITNETYNQAISSNINPRQYLENNDSYHFFDKAGGHLKPGPTGNNLMDLHIVLIG